MSGFKSIGQIAEYKPISLLNMEELAARQRRIEPSGGVLFARTADRDEKSAARQRVVELFDTSRWSRHLHMLTMPSVQWRFERVLLGAREAGWMRSESPRRTYFTSVENDRALYFAAVAQMPGLETPNALVKRTKPFPFAEIGTKTRYATVFFANVDELMAQNWNSGWQAAWLDYTGPLSIERLRIIKHFYQHHISDTLIVTALKARWNRDTNAAIEWAGGYVEWLRKHLAGEILHEIEYSDTVPMMQFAVRHARPLVNGVTLKTALWFWEG